MNASYLFLCAVLLIGMVTASAPMPTVSFAKQGVESLGIHTEEFTLPDETVAEVSINVGHEGIDEISIKFPIDYIAAPEVEVQLFPTNMAPSDHFFIGHSTFNVSSLVANIEHVMVPLIEIPSEFQVGIITHDRSVTTFEYNFDKLPDDLFDGELYDLKPSNSTLGFKFLSKVANDKMGIWLARRNPIPPFVLLVYIDGEEVMKLAENHPPPGGLGVDDAIHEAAKVKNAKSSVSIHARFWETHRETVATATLHAPQTIVEELKSEGHHALYHSSVKGCDFQLQYYNTTGYVSVKILQPYPIQHLMLTAKSQDGDILFREEERQIPYIQQSEEIQFGWYNVIGAEVASEITSITLEAAFDRRDEVHPMHLLKEWIDDNGGNTTGVQEADRGRRHRHTHGFKSVAASRDYVADEVVAEVPYRLLLTNNIVEHNEWVKQFKGNSSTYRALATEYGLGDSSIHFMYMTFFSIVQPNSDVDGLNWRLYFDTLPKEHPPLPLFYTPDEFNFFSFSPVIKNHSAKVSNLWAAEFNTLVEEAPWLEDHVDLERYRTIRGHLESRIFNISGVLTMIPLMDFMSHDDDPSVKLHYDDADQMIYFKAVKPMKKGDFLTVDYEAKRRTKIDFLFQFGSVPQGAIDSAIITLGENSEHQFQLTTEQDSRDSVLKVLQEKIAGESDGDIQDLSEEKRKLVVTAFTDALNQRLQQLPSELRGMREAESKNRHHEADPEHFLKIAQTLLESEKLVLQQHLQWAGDL